MFITTDDLAPSNLDNQFEYWDGLKKRHSDLKLLAFTTADWQFTRTNRNFKDNSIANSDFIDFCNERSDWLSIAYHGLHHTVAMSHQTPKAQTVIIDKMLAIFKKFNKKFEGQLISAYKPPFYRWDANTVQICIDKGIDYFFTQEGIFTPARHLFQSRASINLIDSHTNPECPMPDRIDRVYEQFDKMLTNQYDFQTILARVPK